MKKEEILKLVEEKTGVELSPVEVSSVELVYKTFLEPKLDAYKTKILNSSLFVRKYKQMRTAQKGYFKTKNTLLLEEAKKLEKECDQLIKELYPNAPISEQKKLFK